MNTRAFFVAPILASLAAHFAMADSYPSFDQLPVQPGFPDPLVMRSGEKVATKEDWMQKRAPELWNLFQHYEYGFQPPAPAKVASKVEREDASALGGKATLREVTLSWGRPDIEIHLLLVFPNHRDKPVPTFVGLNFEGNEALVTDPKVRLPNPAAEARRGKELDTWNLEEIIDRGYALATFFCGDVVPDKAEPAFERLKAFRPAERANAPSPDDCATIAAWAWGLSRALDYLITVPEIDGKKVAVTGHSRLGKTALVAGALDPRFAMVLPLQAGCGGTAPARVKPELGDQPNGKSIVETLKRINAQFPYWFDDVFKQFVDEPARLPFDQHELMALCAPRPLLVCAATEDTWANPDGQFALVRAADPVYRLVAGDGLTSEEMPAVGKLQPSRLGYFIRAGKHSMTKVDWDAFLDYADKWLE
ncbi:MAG TPA: acetylxylan esterase [Chthoniobacteraceae bacterium]